VGAFLLLLTKPTKSLAQPLSEEEKIYKLWMPIVIARQEEMNKTKRERDAELAKVIQELRRETKNERKGCSWILWRIIEWMKRK